VTGPFPDLSPLDLEKDPKGCCARLYESDAVRWLLDDQLHPGGERLTRRLAQLAGVARGRRVVDVACGTGATALLLAHELDCDVVGVDLGSRAIEQATHAARAAGLLGRASFVLGDAEALPLADSGFDVALSECSLCTFPDKRRAIAEMVRVVRPGGTVAIADVTGEPDALPAPLRCAAARVACVADARRADDYISLLRNAGCEPLVVEPHDAELASMADRVDARLRVARMLVSPGAQRDQIADAAALARLATEAIARGTLGYALITARRPGLASAIGPHEKPEPTEFLDAVVAGAEGTISSPPTCSATRREGGHHAARPGPAAWRGVTGARSSWRCLRGDGFLCST
jgi:arsenite methyltransferase